MATEGKLMISIPLGPKRCRLCGQLLYVPLYNHRPLMTHLDEKHPGWRR